MQTTAFKSWVQYYVPTALLLFLSVTIERFIVPEDGGYDRLYGFPFAFRSNTVACSLCYEIYVSALALNLAVDLALVYVLFKSLECLGFKVKPHKVLYFVSALILLAAFGYLYLLSIDGFFKWSNDMKFRFVSSELKFELP